MSELDELDFVAVEIHTAGADPASVCAVDMALVRGGEIVAAERWPVRPPTGPTSFSRLHTQLHGVDEAAVADAPEWPEVAAQLDLLAEWGYTPELAVDGAEGDVTLTLRDCPFLDLALGHPQVVCALHCGVVEGVTGKATTIDANPGGKCVIHTAA